MATAERPRMGDDGYRGILTDREREILTGEADVSDSYYYRVVSRVREKIKTLEDDLPALAVHGGLAEDFYDVLPVDRVPHRDLLERAARDRWGDEFRIEVTHWQDGDVDVYAYHNAGRNEEGLRIREKMGVYDGEIGVVRQHLEPDCVVDEEPVVEPGDEQ